MTAKEVVAQLKTWGTDSYKKTLIRHGAREPVYGVKIEDMKKIQKIVKVDYQLALDLYDTGISDAMYLAGLIADDERMTKKDLQHWVEKAYCPMLSEYTVPWVAAGSPHGHAVALKWLDSKKAGQEGIAASGWCTLGGILSITDDADLDLEEIKSLLKRVETTIHDAPNRVRYVMNGFVIAVGAYVKPLSILAVKTAGAIGPVTVDMGDTSCVVPSAVEYIRKVEQRGSIGKKRKSVKC